MIIIEAVGRLKYRRETVKANEFAKYAFINQGRKLKARRYLVKQSWNFKRSTDYGRCFP